MLFDRGLQPQQAGRLFLVDRERLGVTRKVYLKHLNGIDGLTVMSTAN